MATSRISPDAGAVVSEIEIAAPAERPRFARDDTYRRCERLARLPHSKVGETRACLAHRRIAAMDYSERRKFRRSCCWLVERESKLDSTALASEPLLEWAAMAVTRLVLRPSCSKKLRWASPQSGAVRN